MVTNLVILGFPGSASQSFGDLPFKKGISHTQWIHGRCLRREKQPSKSYPEYFPGIWIHRDRFPMISLPWAMWPPPPSGLSLVQRGHPDATFADLGNLQHGSWSSRRDGEGVRTGHPPWIMGNPPKIIGNVWGKRWFLNGKNRRRTLPTKANPLEVVIWI